MPPGEGILRVLRSWGKSCNKLPALTENEAKRTAEVLEKIESRGYFEVSMVLVSKTFQNDSVEYIGVIRGDIERIARRAFPDILDMTLLSYVITDQPVHADQEGREQRRNQKGLSSRRNDLGMTSTIPPQRRAKWTTLRARRPCRHPHPKRSKSNKGASNAARRSLVPGGLSTSPSVNLGPGASMMLSASVARKILNGLSVADNRARFCPSPQNDYHFQLARADPMKLEMVEVAELTRKLARAKKLAIEEFKSSDDFMDALLHHHSNLSVDLASMEMDTDLIEEEEEAKAGKKKEDNEGEANPAP
ncbi:hypothetical protein Acr_07g0012420 [Actinidia rufa]|uniref:Uncharacterized protein n=1 Tax=Actinidia rufa TaxID=165716 RepID=A0A7J0EXY3_9ERIC|nr:hypothetical protein Acr_07g0012420 [Actinidia rufa]